MKKQKPSDQQKLIAQLSAIVTKAEKLVGDTGKVAKKKVKAASKKVVKKVTPKKKPATLKKAKKAKR